MGNYWLDKGKDETLFDVSAYHTKLLSNGPAKYTPLFAENSRLEFNKWAVTSMTTKDLLIRAALSAVERGGKEGPLGMPKYI